jgi:hypothetical protein
MIKMDQGGLPSIVSAEHVKAASTDHFKDMDEAERETEYNNVIETLVIASIFAPPVESEKVASVTAPTRQDQKTAEVVPTLSYTPSARQLIYTTLMLLDIPTSTHLPPIEQKLSKSLFKTLQKVSEQNQEEVQRSREKQAEGWGGKTGRWLATGAGVIAGGVAIGITGGLAAPAIAALIPGFMTFGLLTTATAPVVLGSIFGVTAGGLTGKRVRERWRGVDEFEFVDVKVGSKKVEEVILPPDPEEETVEGDEPTEKERASIDTARREYFALPDSSGRTPAEKDPIDMPTKPAAEKDMGIVSRTESVTSGRPSLDSVGDLEDRTSRISLDTPEERGRRAEDEARLLEGRPPSLVVSPSWPERQSRCR